MHRLSQQASSRTSIRCRCLSTTRSTGPAEARVNLTAALISRKVHRDLPPTTLFGYLRSGGPGTTDPVASYLGPAIVARTGVPIAVNYRNDLAPDDFLRVFTNGGSSYLQFPPVSGGADPDPSARRRSSPANDDGNPYAQPDAFRSGTHAVGHLPQRAAGSAVLVPRPLRGRYAHERRRGARRGLPLRDGFDTGSNPLLPGPIGRYELPIVVQDRQFNADGSLLYPVEDPDSGGPWIGEYFGDVMLVNGKIWPDLVVEPAVYRFRVLNGCNARILNLNINGVPMYIIGAEGGLLPNNPAPTDKLVMAPAERFDVICDFRGLAGKTVFLKNGNPPGPVVTPAPSLTQVMRIRVKQTASSGAPMSVPAAGSLPPNSNLKALVDLGPPKLSGGSVAGQDDHPQRVRHGHAELEAEPQRPSVRRPEPGHRDVEVEQRRGLVLRQHDGRHAPDAHAPVHLQGDGALQLQRQGIRSRVPGPVRRRHSRTSRR